MKFGELLAYISDEDLDFLSAETKVNHQVKKLSGEIIFKLILYSLLESGKPSLRVMEAYFNSARFRALAKTGDMSIKYNSISERISTISPHYFEKIFELLFIKFNRYLKEENALQKYDSTMVAISSRLLDWGMRVGSKTDKRQLKYTLGMQGALPCTFKIYGDQTHLNEDKTIPEVILEYKRKSSGIVVFDRGVQDRKTFVEFSRREVIFVTRLRTNASFEVMDSRAMIRHDAASGVEIWEDLTILFRQRSIRKPLDTPFRLIKGTVKKSGEEIFFLSNNFELDPYEIAGLYKKRWEIEVFFKFIKQELNFSHITNRSENGIRVMMYMTLILSMLILVYKKANKLSGFKIVKVNVVNELQSRLIREIVLLSGGNPDLVTQYLSDS